ncbi:MAG: arginine--tRNA ligase [Alphaproteobacteria bacterium]|nr:arginine--tRNA ligase [Alphaproteobacteria bacterium]
MDIFAEFSARIAAAVAALFDGAEGLDALIDRIVVEPPRDAGHGELSTNAAMILAKPLGRNPRQIAAEIAERLLADPDVAEAEVAGPGFVNLRLVPELWLAALRAVGTEGADYGRSDLGAGQKVNVEFVSANPTGPMHVGHTRGAVFGDALAALMAFCGYDVTREYYINDAGGQIDVLARSALMRYREALGETVEIPKGLYPGDYLVPVGAHLRQVFGDTLATENESDALERVKPLILDAMMDLIRKDLGKLNIHHDVFFSERTLHGQGGEIDLTLAWLRQNDMVYEGRLDPPKGKTPEDWEDREQTLFRATDYGDDTDRPLVKSDGSYTYFAADIAYHRNKVLRGFTHMIDVLGADHSGYIKRIQAATRAVSEGTAEVDVRICQLVRLLKNGEPFKMSKRSGDLVLLSDVVDEVGTDATRFMMLFRRNDASLDFDFAVVKEQTRDNPVFYVQYAHARSCSVFRTAAREMAGLDLTPAGLATAELAALTTEADYELIRVVAQWPRLVATAARAHEPHRVAFYLYDLASAFHAYWTRGREESDLRFVVPGDERLTLARLCLVDALRQVLRNGLAILGVSAPEELS